MAIMNLRTYKISGRLWKNKELRKVDTLPREKEPERETNPEEILLELNEWEEGRRRRASTLMPSCRIAGLKRKLREVEQLKQAQFEPLTGNRSGAESDARRSALLLRNEQNTWCDSSSALCYLFCFLLNLFNTWQRMEECYELEKKIRPSDKNAAYDPDID